MMDKLERKDKRRATRGRGGGDPELDWLSLNGLEPLVEAELLHHTRSQARLVASVCGDTPPRTGALLVNAQACIN